MPAAQEPLPTRHALKIGPERPLPVYDWGQNVYIRFANVVPPNPANRAAQPVRPLTCMTDPRICPTASATTRSRSTPTRQPAITFNLSDVTAGEVGTATTIVDSGTVPALRPTA